MFRLKNFDENMDMSEEEYDDDTYSTTEESSDSFAMECEPTQFKQRVQYEQPKIQNIYNQSKSYIQQYPQQTNYSHQQNYSQEETEKTYRMIDTDLIKSDIGKKLISNVPENTIRIIHPQCHIHYNTLNVCLGKPGCGKSTLMLYELILLDQGMLNKKWEDQFTAIYYITSNMYEEEVFDPETNEYGIKSYVGDETFKALSSLISIPIYGLSTTKAVSTLQQMFREEKGKSSCGYNPQRSNILIIIEDGTYLLDEKTCNPQWLEWFITLRHLKMTVWINAHDWITLNRKLRGQVTSLFIFPGYNTITQSAIVKVTEKSMSKYQFTEEYKNLEPRQCLFIALIPPISKNGKQEKHQNWEKIDLMSKEERYNFYMSDN